MSSKEETQVSAHVEREHAVNELLWETGMNYVDGNSQGAGTKSG